MSGLQPLAWLRGLIFDAPRPATRLTQEQALQLARAVAGRADVSGELEVLDVRTINGRLCWVVGTATKDAGWSVTIDDATGAAGHPQVWNGWSPPK